MSNSRDKVRRISISLPESTCVQLDEMVQHRGFESRSQAINEMVHQIFADHHSNLGEQIMCGTITLFYDHAHGSLKKQLAEIQYQHIDEVISSLHILLEKGHTLEVLIVQGPADKLKAIADELITCKGVKTGRLNLVSTLIPPIHQPE